MNIVKVLSRHRLLGAAILAITLLAACGPAPLGTSWAGLELVGDEQNILVAFNDRLFMVDPVDGKTVRLRNQDGEIRLDDSGNPRLWDIRQNMNSFFSTPVIEDNRLLVPGYNQVLYTVDVPTARIENGTGTPIPGNTGHLVADLTASDDLIYVGLSTRNLVALHRDDFSLAWTVETKHGVWSKPLLVDDTLYFTSLDHYLYAVDAETGAERWTLNLEGAAPASPAYVDGKLYVGSFARKVFEVSAADGKMLSSYDTLDWVWNTPQVVDSVMYVADLAGNVYALNTADGLSEKWKVKPATLAIRSAPLVTDDYVLVASRDQKLYWLNREDGTAVLDSEGRALVREMQSPIFSDILLIEPNETTKIEEPIVVVSTLAVGQMLVAYTLEEGRFLWTHSLQ